MDERGCLVCSAPSKSAHFGIDACRACAAFFKRATLSGNRYPCRQGQRCCEIIKDDKFTCRRCRFDKCIAVGMAYDGPLRVIKKMDEQALNQCAKASTKASSSLLDRIGREYKINVANRLEKELAVLRENNNAVRLPHPSYEVYAGSGDFILLSKYIAIDEAWKFFHKVYPSLNDLPDPEKLELFRFHLPNFNIVDSLFRTWKVWGSFEKYSMSSVAGCIDRETPNTWLAEKEGGINRSTLIDHALAYLQDTMTLLVPSFLKAQVTETEVFALFALMLCDTDVDASEHLLSLLDTIRSEILQDLQKYYKEELGLLDFSARLGNLMTITHTARESASHFHSVLRMYVAIFDVWSAETRLRQFFL